MCAGSGVEHEEQISAAKRLLGIQLWLNLPTAEKMSHPYYHAIHAGNIEMINPADGVTLRLLAGSYADPEGTKHEGYADQHLPLDYYEIALEPGTELTVPVDSEASVMAFTLEGPAKIGGLPIGPKTAIKLEDGNEVELKADADSPSRVLFLVSRAS
jgi:redox-sensitive bicupin YhaK (pirin superfamily)